MKSKLDIKILIKIINFKYLMELINLSYSSDISDDLNISYLYKTNYLNE